MSNTEAQDESNDDVIEKWILGAAFIVVSSIIAMDNMYRLGLVEAPKPSIFWWAMVALAYGSVLFVIVQWFIRGGWHVP